MKITLLTGATGFIGGHLAKRLVASGEKIRCLVTKTSNVEQLKKLEVELVFGDLLDNDSLINSLNDVEVVYHLAAQTRPHRVISTEGGFRDSYRKTNVEGTANLVDASVAKGVRKFVYFSSIAAAGIGEDLTEDMPCRPNSEYGLSKKLAE
jgi:dihydroflavonol-4-reductase